MAGDVYSAHTQDRPQYLIGRAGQHSDAPEWCRDSGYRGTVCVHCARTGLWGGWLGNHRLYPEADAQKPPLCCGLWARLTAGVRLSEAGITNACSGFKTDKGPR